MRRFYEVRNNNALMASSNVSVPESLHKGAHCAESSKKLLTGTVFDAIT